MPTVLSKEQMAEFEARVKDIAARRVAEGQSNLDWFKDVTGAMLTRTELGTVKAAVLSPLTSREVITATFSIDRSLDRPFLETQAANFQPKYLEAVAEDYLHEQLLANLRL